MTKHLCMEYVDPRGLEAILANRLIQLDKGEGAVRPIGVGEVLTGCGSPGDVKTWWGELMSIQWASTGIFSKPPKMLAHCET